MILLLIWSVQFIVINLVIHVRFWNFHRVYLGEMGV